MGVANPGWYKVFVQCLKAKCFIMNFRVAHWIPYQLIELKFTENIQIDDAYHVANGTACDSLAAPSGNVTDNYYPCETGGYGPMTSSTMGTFYYPKFFMDEVRSRCPATCGTCGTEAFPG